MMPMDAMAPTASRAGHTGHRGTDALACGSMQDCPLEKGTSRLATVHRTPRGAHLVPDRGTDGDRLLDAALLRKLSEWKRRVDGASNAHALRAHLGSAPRGRTREQR